MPDTHATGAPDSAPAAGSSSAPTARRTGIAESLERLVSHVADVQKSQLRSLSSLRWRNAILVFGLVVMPIFTLSMLVATLLGWKPSLGFHNDHIAVVRIEGAIGPDQKASADLLVPAITRAMDSAYVKNLVLAIDSPGGDPVDSERIALAITAARQAHPDKTVTAIAGRLCASAAYKIAMAADTIVAARYSLIGSIGAVMSPWSFDKAIAKFDVSQRVYASGDLKAFLNPFTAVTPQADAKAQQMVDELGLRFYEDLVALRGPKLVAGTNYRSGEVWTGEPAKRIGLIDEIGVIDSWVKTKWPSLKMDDYTPAPGPIKLMRDFSADLMVDVIGRLSQTVPAIN